MSDHLTGTQFITASGLGDRISASGSAGYWLESVGSAQSEYHRESILKDLHALAAMHGLQLVQAVKP